MPALKNRTFVLKLTVPFYNKTPRSIRFRHFSRQNFEHFKEEAKEVYSVEFTGRNECHEYKVNYRGVELTKTVCACDTDLCNNGNLVQIRMIGFALALIITNIF